MSGELASLLAALHIPIPLYRPRNQGGGGTEARAPKILQKTKKCPFHF